MLDEKIDIES